MKKATTVIAIILCLALAFAYAGCNKKSGDAAKPDPATTPDAVTSAAATPADDAAASPAAIGATADAPADANTTAAAADATTDPAAKKTAETTPSKDAEPDNWAGNEATESSMPENGTAISAERNEALVKAFTPKGAEIENDEAGSLILSSKKKLSELTKLYKKALKKLGAVQTGLEEDREGFWLYTGTYDEDKYLYIELHEEGGKVSALIMY
ncbi:MAG: hypothetical protein LBG82_07185 [Clostridiales Family XIII bacterium]|jgi:hypothetical protein|nr:hypothetical protein [Clostridiales Family XIII bacterium]